MLTINLKIKSISNIDIFRNYISDYTEIFYKLYKHPDLINNSEYIQFILNNYNIDKSILESCVSDVQTKIKQQNTFIEKKIERIKNIKNLLADKCFKTKNEKRNKYNLIKKLNELKRNINKDCCFGGKSLLRDITRLAQNKNKTNEQNCLLVKYKENFKNKRIIPIYLIGRACENGNRKIFFDFINNKIFFKPNRNINIEIEFYIKSNNKNRKLLLNKLQLLTNNKQIPLTLRISENNLNIIYDELIVNNFKFNNIECKKEQLLHISKEKKKEIYIKYCNELKDRKKINKIENRYMGIDLNPNYIGLSIFDNINNEQKIIYFNAISLNKLKLIKGLSSSNLRQIKRRNKRKHEISEIWKYIFNLCKHYKVYNFVIEDLNFKHNEIKNNKELNKQVKNLWHRTLTNNLINKYCNIIGLNKIEVSPIYSSFIGNMIYPYFDPISSSIEIGRREMIKYIKGFSIYPEITRINQEKLVYLLGENIEINGLSWQQLYKKIFLMRYRNPLNKTNGLIAKNFKSIQSKIITYEY